MESWVEKPRSMFDTAQKRGFLHLKDFHPDKFIEKGTEDAQDHRRKETCLEFNLSQYYDFINQEIMIQQTIQELGSRLQRSPKYHCEIGGEGIKYCWRNAYMLYRRKPYSKRIKKSDFLKVIQEENDQQQTGLEIVQ